MSLFEDILCYIYFSKQTRIREMHSQYQLIMSCVIIISRIVFILLLFQFYGQADYNFGEGRMPFLLAGCPVSNCMATTDTNLVPLESADAVIFHQRSFDKLPPNHL